MVDEFISAPPRMKKSVRYLVPEMKDILSNTYGIIVYQEQIMQLAQKLAGYTLSEADLMRRAMGKKKREEMARHKEKFVTGAVERGIKQEKAEKIFSLMEQFSDYGFNSESQCGLRLPGVSDSLFEGSLSGTFLCRRSIE